MWSAQMQNEDGQTEAKILMSRRLVANHFLWDREQK